MRRVAGLALIAAIAIPAAVVAQSPAPSPPIIGGQTVTYDVCLTISGPASVLWSAENLQAGLLDGTFKVVAEGTSCGTSTESAAPGENESETAAPGDSESESAAPGESPGG